MKKISVALFSFIMCFMVSSVTFAAPPSNFIPKSDLAIGGITLGASESYVKRIYGEPTDISYDSNPMYGSVKTFNYGNSFFVSFDNQGAIEIKSTGNNGLKTPVGFAVGTPISKVEQYYGKACNRGEENGKKYIRCHASWSQFITFTINNKGNIDSMCVFLMP